MSYLESLHVSLGFLYRFLVEGETGNVIEVKASVSPQPTKIGNTELSQYDTIKIQAAYGCEACGGPQTGLQGQLQAADIVTESPCLWWLTSPRTNQILIHIQVSRNIHNH